MKKYLLLCGALLSAGLAYCQETGFEVGVKAGVNNTWIVLDNELTNNEHHNHKFMIKPAAGISLGYKFNDHTSVMLEGMYSRQGANYDFLTGNGTGDKVGEKEIKLDYLAVPLMIKYSSDGASRFTFQVGGQVAILLKGSEQNTFNSTVTFPDTYRNTSYTIEKGTYLLATTDDSKKNDDTGGFNKSDFNVVADIGMEHDLSEKCYFSLGLRLVYGFNEIRDTETVASKFDPDKFTLRYNVLGGIHAGVHWFL